MLSDLIACLILYYLFFLSWKPIWDCDCRISTDRRTFGRLGTRVRRRSYTTVLHSLSPTNPPIPIANPGAYYPSISFCWSLRSNCKKLPGIYWFLWTKLVEYKIRAHSSPISFKKAKDQNLFLSGLLNQDDGKPTWLTFSFRSHLSWWITRWFYGWWKHDTSCFIFRPIIWTSHNSLWT